MQFSNQACWCVAAYTILQHKHQTLCLSKGLLREGFIQ